MDELILRDRCDRLDRFMLKIILVKCKIVYAEVIHVKYYGPKYYVPTVEVLNDQDRLFQRNIKE